MLDVCRDIRVTSYTFLFLNYASVPVKKTRPLDIQICLLSDHNFHLLLLGDNPVIGIVAWERGIQGGGIPCPFIKFYKIKRSCKMVIFFQNIFNSFLKYLHFLFSLVLFSDPEKCFGDHKKGCNPLYDNHGSTLIPYIIYKMHNIILSNWELALKKKPELRQ